jgi:hypothetical protein
MIVARFLCLTAMRSVACTAARYQIAKPRLPVHVATRRQPTRVCESCFHGGERERA